MADREKVIKWLAEEAVEHEEEEVRDLAHTALLMLEEQEPRVVTTADFENNPNLDDGGHLNVWEEYKDGTRYRWNTINVNDVRAFTDIHRYWTSRPTPEQMRETKWEGEGIK